MCACLSIQPVEAAEEKGEKAPVCSRLSLPSLKKKQIVADEKSSLAESWILTPVLLFNMDTHVCVAKKHSKRGVRIGI